MAFYYGPVPITGANEAGAFLQAIGGKHTISLARQSAIITLVQSLKAAGVWDKLICYYPFVGKTTAANSLNLLDPNSFQISWGNTSNVIPSSTGITLRMGTSSGYGIIPIYPLQQFVNDYNSFSIGMYMSSDTQKFEPYKYHFGVHQPSTPLFTIETWIQELRFFIGETGQQYTNIQNSTIASGGFYGVSRDSGASFISTRNTSIYSYSAIEHIPLTVNDLPDLPLRLNINNTGQAYPLHFGTAWVGYRLTSQELADLRDITIAYNTAVNRDELQSSSIRFSGGQKITIPKTTDDLRINNNLSVVAWVNVNAVTTGQSIISDTYSGNHRKFNMWLQNTRTLYVSLSQDGASEYWKAYNTASLSLGWHMVGFTYSGNTLILYVDGAAVAVTKTYDSAMTQLCDSVGNITIGRLNDNGDPASTEIDAIRIFKDTVLSAADFATLFTYKPGQYPRFTPSGLSGTLAAQWWLGEDDDVTTSGGIHDSVGTAHGTGSGFGAYSGIETDVIGKV